MTARVLVIAGALALSGAGVRADRFDTWDRNKDGLLQKNELPERVRRNFERVDTNRDGVISRQEDAAFTSRQAKGPGGPGGNPAPASGGVEGIRVVRDLDYVGNGNPRQYLDLFLPEAKSEAPRPLVVFIHGGGWQNGSKDAALRRLSPILKSGVYAGAALNYRLTDEASWPAQIEDCKAAIRWLKGHAGEYGYDGSRIAVWGTSAGGHLVAMLGVTGDVPTLEGTLGKHRDEDSTVSCVIDYFGPANLLTMDDHPSSIRHGAANSPEGKLVGGALVERRETAVQASPVTHVSQGDAPFLIAHGSADPLVPYMQSVELSKLLQAADVPVTLIRMVEAGHGFRSEELEKRVAAFLGRYLLGSQGEISSDPIPKGK